MNSFTDSKMAARLELWPTNKLVAYAFNARTHSDDQVEKIAASIAEFGFNAPILVDVKDNTIIAGHGRLMAAELLGLREVPVIPLSHMTEAQRRAYILADNKLADLSGWDEGLLAHELAAIANFGEFDLSLTGFDDDEMAQFVGAELVKPMDIGKDLEVPEFLVDRFGVPPFSILDTRQGYWQERKRKWKAVIKDDGESREGTLFKETNGESTEFNQKIAEVGTVSILDPVLAEIMLRWFCPSGGSAFDTFAGDTVFGYVAARLGHDFTGIELRQEQADLNNARTAADRLPARYICDDGQNVLNHLAPDSQDFFFSCPPYFDLEVYSDDPRDASNQGDYEGFRLILENAFAGAAKALKANRFACVVMSNVRDGRGFYQDICGDIRAIMRANGLALYNELILINAVGTASMRAGNYMKNRKVARTHQNVMLFYKGESGEQIYMREGFDLLPKLEAVQFHEDVMIFYKGDPSKIRNAYGEVDTADELSEGMSDGE
jgi:ParB-like chromosome segregation protein Spo0J